MWDVVDPAEDPNTMLDVVPSDLKTPYDIRVVIDRIVDAGTFDEFKERYGTTLASCPPLP